MRSRLSPNFRRDLQGLPTEIQRRARRAYRRFVHDPFNRGLQFKQVGGRPELWSVRISHSYRALGVRKTDDEIIWIFVGTHAEYDRLLHSL